MDSLSCQHHRLMSRWALHPRIMTARKKENLKSLDVDLLKRWLPIDILFRWCGVPILNYQTSLVCEIEGTNMWGRGRWMWRGELWKTFRFGDGTIHLWGKLWVNFVHSCCFSETAGWVCLIVSMLFYLLYQYLLFFYPRNVMQKFLVIWLVMGINGLMRFPLLPLTVSMVMNVPAWKNLS